jgi:hypothetical protein
MTDVHTNGRVTHPDRQTLRAAEATQIRLASYLPDDMEDEPRAAPTAWDRLLMLAGLTVAAWLLVGVLGFLALIEVGSGVLGS